jgi:pimeloyl-ACP methyl ester carboxylesterase
VLLPPIGHGPALYDGVARQLADEIDVVLLDYPDQAEGSLAEVAGGMAAAAGPCDAIGGVSLGATLCHLVQTRLPRPPHALFLMAPGGLPPAQIRRESVLAAMDELGPIAFAERHFGLADADLDRSSVSQHFGVVTDEARAYWRSHVEAARARLPALAATWCRLLRAALAADLRSEMAANRVPAEVIWGDADRIFPERYIQSLTRVLGRARLHVLPGVGHYPPLEAPGRVAAIVRDVLLPERGEHEG